jgi:hypothetical protein
MVLMPSVRRFFLHRLYYLIPVFFHRYNFCTAM